jgi:hypothetical protein
VATHANDDFTNDTARDCVELRRILDDTKDLIRRAEKVIERTRRSEPKAAPSRDNS